nr:hypothetical protein [Ferrimicrobium acidiphilum]
MVGNTLASLADPRVLAAVSPSDEESFDPADFLRRRGTLYLFGAASGTSATAGLVSALIEDAVEVARWMAAASPGARPDPPPHAHLGRGCKLSAAISWVTYVRRRRYQYHYDGCAAIASASERSVGIRDSWS